MERGKIKAKNLSNSKSKLAIGYIKNFLEDFDTSKLLYLKFEPGNNKYYGVYGMCRYPLPKKYQIYNTESFYRISCFIPGPFPANVSKEIPPKSKQPLEKYKNLKNVRMKKVSSVTKVKSQDEAMVWIFGHEIFHFLRHSRQIPGRNVEYQADDYGDKILEQYRAWKRGSI